MHSLDLQVLQNLRVASSSVPGKTHQKYAASSYATRCTVWEMHPLDVNRVRSVRHPHRVFPPKPRRCCSYFKNRSLFVSGGVFSAPTASA